MVLGWLWVRELITSIMKTCVLCKPIISSCCFSNEILRFIVMSITYLQYRLILKRDRSNLDVENITLVVNSSQFYNIVITNSRRTTYELTGRI